MANLIRIGHSLNKGEEQNVAKRRLTVQGCLAKNDIKCPTDKVPNIALIGSGGGERAMVALLGSLLQLKKENLLDATLYLSGVSGSTWCMSSLYKKSNWSSRLKDVACDIAKRLGGPKVTWKESGAKLKKYYLETDNYTLTHFWAAVAVPTWVKEIDEQVLSDQRREDSEDPYPIYTVIDKKIKSNQQALKDKWVEMTPDEAGYTLAGAYVDQGYFGSKFDRGNLKKKQSEMDMAYVQGICGSALADRKQIVQQLWQWLKDIRNHHGGDVESGCQSFEVVGTLVDINLLAANDQDYTDLADKINLLLQGKLDVLGLAVGLEIGKGIEDVKRFTLQVCERLEYWYKDEELKVAAIWTWVKIIASTAKCIWNWTWGTTYNFLNNINNPDIDSVLAGETRDYIDAGLLENSPYFSVLRKERNIDLIISLDFSAGDPMMTIEEAHKMAEEMRLSFPPVKIQPDPKGPNDFYEFPGPDGCPNVIHMPLFNVVNCGDQIEEWRKRYSTFQGAYSPDMISDLMAKAAENVKNNKDKLLGEIKKAMMKKY